MEKLPERVLAYDLARIVTMEELEDVSGGISINIPTFTLTAQPLSPDVIFDS